MSVGFTGVALFQVVRDDSFWMWLCFAAVALAAVSFYELYRHHSETEGKAQELPSRLDALAREGIQMLTELSQPVQPQKGKGSFTYSLVPDSGLWDKAFSIDQRARKLLIELRPSLLVDYAAAANASLKRYRAKETRRDEEEKNLGTAEKLRRFTERSHQRPAAYAEAFLAGVAAARNRLGH